jgi:hypothetical protein
MVSSKSLSEKATAGTLKRGKRFTYSSAAALIVGISGFNPVSRQFLLKI